MALILVIFVSSLLLLSGCRAQSCNTETFSENRNYALCSPLSELGATLHWTYHAANGTADVAYRVQQDANGWAAWAINPTATGMIGANALLAFHDASTSAVRVITTVINDTSYNPTIRDENLTFPVHSRAAEYAAGAYTIYATVGLPNNSTTQSTVWQAGDGFQNGLPYGHPQTIQHTTSFSSLNFLSGQAAAEGAGGAAASRLHRKNIHGVLNAVSWGLLFPLGVIIARYMRVFKSLDPAWFYLHIACQCSGYILGVAGWGLGLKLGSESKGIVYHRHRDIGITLFCLATLQVFALLLRPNKDHKYRIVWNIYHWTIGYMVIILSVVNIFKGFNILNPANKWKHAYIAVLVTLACIAAVLEIFTWAVVLNRKRKTRSDDKSHNSDTNGSNGYGVRPHQGV
ncbi:Cytochrome b561 and DOMON domain-containing protein [Ananas comosus]|uniref:Cytochrome b561 and DOMON domain-containing protein n=1 Tax=Ananas comosus TaxID=4615 RepID=A0A199W8J4_ANACO|nr:Cytochrome b561 and DOMON domain-containing protein [Ananas comosus]